MATLIVHGYKLPGGWMLSRREDGRIEFLCEHGIGHSPVWSRDTTHGCDGCCSRDDFPGRTPEPGDFALCGRGHLGLILGTGRSRVTYPDGASADAWTGVHLTGPGYGPWSSRNPIIIGRGPKPPEKVETGQ